MLPNFRREIERALVREAQKLILSSWDLLHAAYSRLHEANKAWFDGLEVPIANASERLARRFRCCDGNHAGPSCGDPECWFESMRDKRYGEPLDGEVPYYADSDSIIADEGKAHMPYYGTRVWAKWAPEKQKS